MVHTYQAERSLYHLRDLTKMVIRNIIYAFSDPNLALSFSSYRIRSFAFTLQRYLLLVDGSSSCAVRIKNLHPLDRIQAFGFF